MDSMDSERIREITQQTSPTRADALCETAGIFGTPVGDRHAYIPGSYR